MLRHHAPFGDHGFAHLSGILRADDFVDLERNFLADKALQLRHLNIIMRDDLKRLRSGLKIAKPVRRRQRLPEGDPQARPLSEWAGAERER